ncbi:MAG: glycosyltransferase, partial [Candidatus Portnoybacteria bacterium]|nr:glycosyltransferase [Candidatus Portnoybacteria bacterium]
NNGIGEYVSSLLKSLPLVDGFSDHQFFLYTPFSVSGFDDYVIRVVRWPFNFGWSRFRLGFDLIKDRLDVVFVPSHGVSFGSGRVVSVVQGLEYEAVPDMYSFGDRWFKRRVVKKSIDFSDAVVVPSKKTKNDLVDFYGIDESKISIIPHGVSAFDGDKADGRYILYLGSGHKRKNIIGLINAFSLLRSKYGIDHRLVIAGCSELGSFDGVDFRGVVDFDEKWRLLRGADVFVFPSFYEGFGFPVLEAQSVGVPVACSDRGSLKEVLGNSALFFDPFRVDKIAQSIFRIIDDGGLRDDLTRKGLVNVKRFNWLDSAKKTLDLLTYENRDNT